MREVDEHYCHVKSELFQIEDWRFGKYHVVFESDRSRLVGQLDILLHEKRTEEVQAWQDIAQLKRELRTWWKQYKDLGSRTKMLLPK